MRSQGELLLVDCGGVAPDDGVTSATITGLAFAAMAKMGYDAINIGPLEAIFAGRINYQGFVSANMFGVNSRNLVTAPYKLIPISGMTVAVIGLTPDVPVSGVKRTNVSQADAALADTLREVRPLADMVILLSQYSARETELILNAVGKVDIAITSPGGINQNLKQIDNGSYIVSTGSGCSRLQSLEVFSDSSGITKIVKSTVQLDNLVMPDPEIITITGFDKNETLSDIKAKELKQQKKQTKELSSKDPMEILKKMSETEQSEESKLRLEKQLKIKDN